MVFWVRFFLMGCVCSGANNPIIGRIAEYKSVYNRTLLEGAREGEREKLKYNRTKLLLY